MSGGGQGGWSVQKRPARGSCPEEGEARQTRVGPKSRGTDLLQHWLVLARGHRKIRTPVAQMGCRRQGKSSGPYPGPPQYPTPRGLGVLLRGQEASSRGCPGGESDNPWSPGFWSPTWGGHMGSRMPKDDLGGCTQALSISTLLTVWENPSSPCLVPWQVPRCQRSML